MSLRPRTAEPAERDIALSAPMEPTGTRMRSLAMRAALVPAAPSVETEQ